MNIQKHELLLLCLTYHYLLHVLFEWHCHLPICARWKHWLPLWLLFYSYSATSEQLSPGGSSQFIYFSIVNIPKCNYNHILILSPPSQPPATLTLKVFYQQTRVPLSICWWYSLAVPCWEGLGGHIWAQWNGVLWLIIDVYYGEGWGLGRLMVHMLWIYRPCNTIKAKLLNKQR